MNACGVILAGGRSTRMGTSKADLEWAGATMLQQTVNVLEVACDGVVIVAAPDQAVNIAGVTLVRDRLAGQGPLRALDEGLRAARRQGAEVAFVCATDMPLLRPQLVTRVLAAFTPDVSVVVPVIDSREHPLAAAYSTALVDTLAEMLSRGERRLRAVFDRCRVRRLTRTELLRDPALAAADPQLDCLLNVNTPAQLAAARARAGHRPG